ncbi:hypothetical protein ACHAPT_012327 [Fusarium lateritium]
MRGRDGILQAGALEKLSVAKAFRELSDDENASGFSNDLMDFIEKKLLRIDPKERASCTEVYTTFQRLYGACEADTDYCLLRVKPQKRLSVPEAPIQEESDISDKGCDGSLARILPSGCESSSKPAEKRRVDDGVDGVVRSASPDPISGPMECLDRNCQAGSSQQKAPG